MVGLTSFDLDSNFGMEQKWMDQEANAVCQCTLLNYGNACFLMHRRLPNTGGLGPGPCPAVGKRFPSLF